MTDLRPKKRTVSTLITDWDLPNTRAFCSNLCWFKSWFCCILVWVKNSSFSISKKVVPFITPTSRLFAPSPDWGTYIIYSNSMYFFINMKPRTCILKSCHESWHQDSSGATYTRVYEYTVTCTRSAWYFAPLQLFSVVLTLRSKWQVNNGDLSGGCFGGNDLDCWANCSDLERVGASSAHCKWHNFCIALRKWNENRKLFLIYVNNCHLIK